MYSKILDISKRRGIVYPSNVLENFGYFKAEGDSISFV